MKKTLALILALVMCTICFASCAKSDDVLTCGVTIFANMNEQDADGNWTGFESEFAMEVGKILDMKVEFQKEFSLFFFIDQPILAPIFGASGLNRNDIVFRISHYTDYIKPNKNARVNTRYKAPLHFCLFSCRKISGDIRNKTISIHGHLFNQIKVL